MLYQMPTYAGPVSQQDMRGMRWHAGIAVAGLIAISLCLTVTILELMKLKREALAEAAQKEEAGKALNGPPFRHSHPSQVPDSCQHRATFSYCGCPQALKQSLQLPIVTFAERKILELGSSDKKPSSSPHAAV